MTVIEKILNFINEKILKKESQKLLTAPSETEENEDETINLNAIYKYLKQDKYTRNLAVSTGKIKQSVKKSLINKIDIREAKLTTLRAMITMWYEYSQYYGIYNTNNILSWTKGLKEVYDQNKDYYIGEEVIEEEIENKKRFILEEQKQITPCITFENFLELVDKSPISEYKNI